MDGSAKSYGGSEQARGWDVSGRLCDRCGIRLNLRGQTELGEKNGEKNPSRRAHVSKISDGKGQDRSVFFPASTINGPRLELGQTLQPEESSPHPEDKKEPWKGRFCLFVCFEPNTI